MMMTFLMEAHEERDEHEVIKTWVKQVRDVAYDADDSLQDFAVFFEQPTEGFSHLVLLKVDPMSQRITEIVLEGRLYT